MVINYFPTTGGVDIEFLSAASLPATGVENQILVITEETVSEYYLDTNEPVSPAHNAVWFGLSALGTVTLEVDADKNFNCNLVSTKMYDSATDKWMNCAGYIYKDGSWVQFSLGLPTKNTLENTSWADIAIISEAGKADTYWSIGDEKIVIVDGVERSVRIVGFDHFKDEETWTKKGIVFEFTKPLDKTYAFNTKINGGAEWGNATLKDELNDDFFLTLPFDLQTVIRGCAIPYCSDSTTAAYYTVSKVFILSCEEYGLGTYSIYSAEADATETLAYYAAGNDGPWDYLQNDYVSLATRSRYKVDSYNTILTLDSELRKGYYIDLSTDDFYVAPAFVV